MILDDLERLKRLDAHGTRAVLAAFPAQCRGALRLRVESPRRGEPPRLVIVAAMGGSAAGGDLVATVASGRTATPILVHRGYGLPDPADGRALVIASSYSGETAEVLSAAEAALARGVPLVAVTAGGTLARLAAERGVPRIALPGGLMPRMALGYLCFAAVAALRAAGLDLLTAGEAEEAVDVLERQALDLVAERPTAENEAKRIAVAVGDRWAAIYGGPLTGCVAYRWKTDLAENAKTFALAGTLPEMNHNEVEAWQGPGARRLHAVLLRDGGEPPEIARRFEVLRELIGGCTGGVSEAWTRGSGPLARVLSLACLGQWVSYYAAMLRGVDPWPVPLLDEIKRRLRSSPPP